MDFRKFEKELAALSASAAADKAAAEAKASEARIAGEERAKAARTTAVKAVTKAGQAGARRKAADAALLKAALDVFGASEALSRATTAEAKASAKAAMTAAAAAALEARHQAFAAGCAEPVRNPYGERRMGLVAPDGCPDAVWAAFEKATKVAHLVAKAAKEADRLVEELAKATEGLEKARALASGFRALGHRNVELEAEVSRLQGQERELLTKAGHDWAGWRGLVARAEKLGLLPPASLAEVLRRRPERLPLTGRIKVPVDLTTKVKAQ